MEMPTVLRVNLVLLVLGTFVLNFAIASAWASSANGATQEQVQSFQSDAGNAAEEEMAYYRQPLERLTRAGASGKSLFYPSQRFSSVRFIIPSGWQHILASRLNADYPGKRMGSEFLGKRSSSSVGSESRSPDSPFAEMQKKMGSEFLGKR